MNHDTIHQLTMFYLEKSGDHGCDRNPEELTLKYLEIYERIKNTINQKEKEAYGQIDHSIRPNGF